MRLTFALLCVLAINGFPPKAAHAGEVSGGELLSLCTATDQASSTACRSYVLGAVQGLSVGDRTYLDGNGKFAERQKTSFCMPDNMPQSQLVLIVTDAMKEVFAAYPSDKHLPAPATILAAMHHGFPCRR